MTLYYVCIIMMNSPNARIQKPLIRQKFLPKFRGPATNLQIKVGNVEYLNVMFSNCDAFGRY